MTSDNRRPVLLLIDGHSMAYRAFFALPVENFTTSSGQVTNAVHGFTSMLINVVRDERPTALAVAFDVSRRSFRTERFPDYKANRSASPPEFSGQVDLIQEVLTALSIPFAAIEGFEADDVIATLATEAQDDGYDVLILTGDRDAFQLVNDRVTVLYPKRGVADLVRFTPAAVKEKYGLDPEQYPDFAALRGDPSDNLPGIPGVGEKTATKWINQYGSLASLLERSAEVGGKVGESLRDNLDQVRRNRELTELVRDAPVAMTVDSLVRQEPQPEAVDSIFSMLEFRVLRDRVGEVFGGPGGAAPGSDTAVDIIPITSTHEWQAFLDDRSASGWAIAWTGRRRFGSQTIDEIAVAGWDCPGVAWIDWASATPDLQEAVWQFLANSDCPKSGHNLKSLALAAVGAGRSVDGLACDTELAAYLLDPGVRHLGLADIAARYLGRTITAESPAEQLSLVADPAPDGRNVATQAAAVAELSPVLLREVADHGVHDLLVAVEIPLTVLLARMESVGIAVDVSRLTAVAADLGTRIADYVSEAHELAGREFSLGSPKQLQEILFGERGLPKTKKIKTGYTTDAEALRWLSEVADDPLPTVLLAWREVTKLRQAVDGLLPLVARDGRIHTTFGQTVAATGRLSSSDPNLQNIPVRTADGRKIRSAFVAQEPFGSIMTADYAQIELRLMAHMSGDRRLIETFQAGEDLHSTMAVEVFGHADPETRRRIKAMSYGLAYGLSAYGLSQQLDISATEAAALMERYFDRFGGVRDFLEQAVEDARQSGYTTTIMGRRRYLPDLNSSNRQRREMAERMALNAPIQGSAADLVKVAMLRVDQRLTQARLRSRLLLQVHDELVLEVMDDEREAVVELTRETMESAGDLSVPLGVSIGVGPNWDEAAH